jgi:hypothetical protein
MAISAEAYRRASAEWLRTAQDLLDNRLYGQAHYVAGLAVECMLRA